MWEGQEQTLEISLRYGAEGENIQKIQTQGLKLLSSGQPPEISVLSA